MAQDEGYWDLKEQVEYRVGKRLEVQPCSQSFEQNEKVQFQAETITVDEKQNSTSKYTYASWAKSNSSS